MKAQVGSKKSSIILFFFILNVVISLQAMKESFDQEPSFLAYYYKPKPKPPPSLLKKVKKIKKKKQRAATQVTLKKSTKKDERSATQDAHKQKKPNSRPLLAQWSVEDCFALDEEDTKPLEHKNINYQEWVVKLEKKLFYNNNDEYCHLFNVLSNNIAQREPLKQLEIYFTLLFNNVTIHPKIFILFWKIILNIYTTYCEEYDQEQKLKDHIDTLLETFLIPYIPDTTLEELQEAYPYLKQEPITPRQQIPIETQESFPFIQPYKALSKKEKPSYQWYNPRTVSLPLDTTYFTAIDQHCLMAVTRNNAYYRITIDQDTLESIFIKQDVVSPKCIPYFIALNAPHIRILQAEPESIPSAIVCAFDRYFFGEEDGTIIINNANNQFLAKLTSHTKQISTLLALENHKKQCIVSSSYDGTIKIWNLKKRRPVITLKSQYGKIDSLTKTVGNDLIALSNKKYFEIWRINNIRKPEKIRTIETISSPITSIIGKDHYFISGSLDSTLLMWNPQTGKCIQETELPHKSPIKKLSIQNNTLIAVQEDEQNTLLTFFMQKSSET